MNGEHCSVLELFRRFTLVNSVLTMPPAAFHRYSLFRVAVALALGASQLAAQGPITGVIRSAHRITRDEATRQCPTFVLQSERPFENVSFGDTPRDSAALDTRCDVDSTYSLPTADGARWLAAIYHRTYIGPSDSVSVALRHSTRDTAVLITAVLYSASNTDSVLRREWTGIVDQSMTRSIAPTLANRPDGSALVSIMSCVNGTGGCSQSYLRRHRGQWTEVVEAFWKQIPRIKDGEIGKGRGIDIRSLTGSYGLYGRRDANCCASREIVLELAQHGDSLILKTYHLRTLER
jgi:hypothetical protein